MTDIHALFFIYDVFSNIFENPMFATGTAIKSTTKTIDINLLSPRLVFSTVSIKTSLYLYIQVIYAIMVCDLILC